MVSRDKIRGIIPPVITPFKENGEIDFEKLDAEMKVCVESGVHGLSVSGSTGEGPTIRDEELPELIKHARAAIGPDKPVVCGIMRTCTRDAVRSGLIAKEAGADAIMVTPTAYNVLVPDEEGMFAFYSTICKEVDMPVIIYNVIPQNTITPRLFERLLKETDNLMAVKQSVGGVPALYAMNMVCGDKGVTFAATDDMLFTCFTLGASGAISAVAAVFPEESIAMWECAQKGDFEKGMEIQNKIFPAWKYIEGPQFPIRVKYALSVLGRDGGYCRSPIVNLTEEQKRNIEKAFSVF